MWSVTKLSHPSAAPSTTCPASHSSSFPDFKGPSVHVTVYPAWPRYNVMHQWHSMLVKEGKRRYARPPDLGTSLGSVTAQLPCLPSMCKRAHQIQTWGLSPDWAVLPPLHTRQGCSYLDSVRSNVCGLPLPISLWVPSRVLSYCLLRTLRPSMSTRPLPHPARAASGHPTSCQHLVSTARHWSASCGPCFLAPLRSYPLP